MAEALRIPAQLAATVVRWTGDEGRDWLARLPTIVAEVAAAWDLAVADPLEPGGNISWVAPARRRDDDVDAVLKVQLPDPDSEPEALGLAAWAGAGAVRLLAHDPDRRALLIERCRPGRPLQEEGGTAAAAAAGAAIGRRLHDAPIPAGVPTLASMLGPTADRVEARTARQGRVDPGVVADVLATMRATPTPGSAAVLLHGDLNPTNILTAAREPWLAIDPKPMVGDPAYDGPRLVLQPDATATADPAATIATRLAVVADVLEVDRARLARWCLVDAVQISSFTRELDDPGLSPGYEALVPYLLPHL